MYNYSQSYTEREGRRLRGDNASRAMTVFAFLLPAATAVLVCLLLGVYPFGSGSLINTYNRDFFESLGALCRTASEGGSFAFSFSRGLGEDLFVHRANLLSNPLYLVSVLFGTHSLADSFLFLTVLRLGFAGVFAYVMVTRLCRRRAEACLAFAVAYGGCGCFTLSLVAPQLVDAAVFLPLIGAGIFSLLEKGHVVMLCLGLAGFLFTSPTLWPVALLFSLAFFTWGSIILDSVVYVPKAALTLVLAFAVSMGLSAVIWLPSASASDELSLFLRTLSDSPTVGIRELLSGLFMGGGTGENGSASALLYCSSFTLLMVPVYFVNSELERSERQFAFFFMLLLLCSLLLPVLSWAWTAFSVPVAYESGVSSVFCCMSVALAARGLSRPAGINVGKAIISWALGVLLFVGSTVLGGGVSVNMILFIGAFLTLYAAVIMVIMADKKPPAIFAVIIMLCIFSESIIAGTVMLREIRDSGGMLTHAETVFSAEADETVSALINGSELASGRQGSFMRVRGSSDVVNADKLYSLRAIDAEAPFSPQETRLTLRRLGISGRYGYTPLTDALLSVRYILSREKLSGDYVPLSVGEGCIVYENKDALTPCFTASRSVMGNIDAENPFTAGNQLVSAILGRSLKVYTPSVMLGCQGVGAHVLEALDGLEATRYEESAHISFTLLPQREGTLYMYLDSGLSDSAVVSIGGRVISDGSEPRLSGILELGSFERSQEVTVDIEMTEQHAALGAACFATLDREVLSQALEALKERQLRFASCGGDFVRGTVECATDEVLMTTIPYMNAWKVTVDGERAQAVKIDGSLLAVPLSAGTHTVQLVYSPPEAFWGVCISAVFLLLFLLFIVTTERRVYLASLPAPVVREQDDIPDAEPLPEISELLLSDAAPVYNPKIDIDLDFESDENQSKWL